MTQEITKKDAKRALERLRQAPDDPQALGTLEGYLGQGSQRAARRARGAGRFGLRVWAGRPLREASLEAWSAWVGHLDGGRQGSWPKEATGEFAAALLGRLTRVGFLGLCLAALPAIMLLFQTALMVVQLWQVRTQNDIIREQNQLTRAQFGLAYQSQFRALLHDERCEPGGTSCKPVASPQARAEAAAGLVALGRLGDREGALIRGVNLQGVDLARADLGGATFVQVDLQRAALEGARFVGSTLDRSNLDGARASGVVLDQAILRQSSAKGADLRGASARRATWYGANFKGAALDRAVFDGATLYPEAAPVAGRMESAASFLGAKPIRGASFEGANLVGAIFQGVTLNKASFKQANLRGANFSGASLVEVDLEGADLEGAVFDGARFERVRCPNGQTARADGCAR